MAEELKSVLVEDHEISWPGFRLRRLALNQHMPRVEKLTEHRHRFHQLLLYLAGYGVQHTEDASIPVARGSVVMIPSGMGHRFVKERQRRPVCLALDFEADVPEGWKREGLLSASGLAEVERLLVELNGQLGKGENLSVDGAIPLLQIVREVTNAIVVQEHPSSSGPVHASIIRVVERIGVERLTPGAVADWLGVTLDHLNRQLRRETGMTTGQFLNSERLKKSGQLLRTTSLSIGEVGSEVGIDDQNYFSRWFRRHTGHSPTRWREAMS